jgi:hypothetical protein
MQIMGTRTVRLDEETERELSRLRKLTGLSISEVLKRGVIAYRDSVFKESEQRPYEVYRQLDLGAGGHARAAAKDAKKAIGELLRRKHKR